MGWGQTCIPYDNVLKKKRVAHLLLPMYSNLKMSILWDFWVNFFRWLPPIYLPYFGDLREYFRRMKVSYYWTVCWFLAKWGHRLMNPYQIYSVADNLSQMKYSCYPPGKRRKFFTPIFFHEERKLSSFPRNPNLKNSTRLFWKVRDLPIGHICLSVVRRLTVRLLSISISISISRHFK